MKRTSLKRRKCAVYGYTRYSALAITGQVCVKHATDEDREGVLKEPVGTVEIRLPSVIVCDECGEVSE